MPKVKKNKEKFYVTLGEVVVLNEYVLIATSDIA